MINIVVISFTLLLLGCRGTSLSGYQAQRQLRQSYSHYDLETQRRIAKHSQNFKSTPDIKRIVDDYLAPCTSCDNHNLNGREVETRRTSARRPANVSRLEVTYEAMGGSPRALRQAMCFMDRHKDTVFRGGHGTTKIKDHCKMSINEHAGKGTRGNKMFIVNKCTGEIKVMNVTRGRNGIGQGQGKTNPGFHISGGWHHSPSGKRWSPGIKMVGLQSGVNDEAWGRGVVMHRAINAVGDYCSGGMNSSESSHGDVSGDCGRSNGCPAVESKNWDTVVKDLKGDSSGGVLIYNYTDREKSQGDDYCGDRLKKVSN